MGNSLVLTLIRHGLTKYNEERRYIGSTDLPLSENGRAQLQSIIERRKAGLLVTSDLYRCVETMQILFPHQPYELLSSLRENDFGKWEGKAYDELKHDLNYCEWLNDPYSVTPPAGESFIQFEKRVKKALEQVISFVEEKGVKSATVVTHGGVIRQLLTSYAPVKKAFFEWDVPIGCAFTLSGKLADVRRGLRFTSLQEERITAKTNG